MTVDMAIKQKKEQDFYRSDFLGDFNTLLSCTTG